MLRNWVKLILLTNVTIVFVIFGWQIPRSINSIVSSHNDEQKIFMNIKATFANSDSVTNTSIREDGTIMVNNQPFFPFGLYHDSSYISDWYGSNTKRLEDLKVISAAGFNTIRPQVGGNYDADVAFLNEAQSNGIYVLSSFNYDKRTKIVDRYKFHPAILGWEIVDDVDHPNNAYSVGGVIDWKAEIKSTDSNRITYVSGAFPTRIEPFFNLADVLGFQSYPIDNDPNVTKPLRSHYYALKSVTEAARRNNQSIIANLQTFAWRNIAPSPKQLRNMTYSALINNVKGIIYYSYFYPGWELSENSALWNELKSLVPEIKQLNSVLLEGSWKRLNSGTENLFAAQWTYKESIYVVALNASPTDIIETSISIPEAVNGSVEALFSNRPQGMIFNQGKLSGSIQPEDVHVYKLSL